MFKKIKTVIVDQIKMGVTPEKIAQSVLTGALIGIFPLLGTTTLIAAVTATKLKLNHVVTQAVNYLLYPLQIIMIPIYVKIVGLIFNVGDVPIRPDLIFKQFNESPSIFITKYGLIGFYAVIFWALLSLILYFIFYPIILKFIIKLKRKDSTWIG